MQASFKINSGFTLVELLVVISIIAVLSVIGITVFSGVQKNARDARRRADIDAITKTMEVNKTQNNYVGLSDTWFSSGKVPTDPGSFIYCAQWGFTPTSPLPSFTNQCPQYSSPVSGTGSGAPQGNPYWQVCASLENPGSSPTVYCKANQQ